MATPIRDGKLIYHLTDIRNFENILTQGILPRRGLSGYVDVADPEIIRDRRARGLDSLVPFHFFCRNPFDGRVANNHPEKSFIYLTIARSVAKANGFRILPRHPLADGSPVELLGYDEGISAIDWDLMETRDYHDQECKLVCMAECLSPQLVPISLIHSIYTSCEEDKTTVLEVCKRHPGVYTRPCNVNERMFVTSHD